MAKRAGDPDSATSQWFINLVDNSASLDVDNGGYTVFGDVLNSGMSVIDAIAGHPIYDSTYIHSAFAELPLIDFLSDPIVAGNLVRINQVSEILEAWLAEGSESDSRRTLAREFVERCAGELLIYW